MLHVLLDSIIESVIAVGGVLLWVSSVCWDTQQWQFQFTSSTQKEIEKLLEDKDSENTKRSTKVAKELFYEYLKEKNIQEPHGHSFCTFLSVWK